MIRAVEIIRGAVTRTVPAVLVGFALLVGSSSYARAHISLARIALTVAAAFAVAAGSALALLAMRSRLRSDAAVAGRRAFITGLAGFALATTIRPFLSFVHPAGDYLLMGAAGAALAVTMFFPWLESRRAGAAAITDSSEAGLTLGAPLPDITSVSAAPTTTTTPDMRGMKDGPAKRHP